MSLFDQHEALVSLPDYVDARFFTRCLVFCIQLYERWTDRFGAANSTVHHVPTVCREGFVPDAHLNWSWQVQRVLSRADHSVYAQHLAR